MKIHRAVNNANLDEIVRLIEEGHDVNEVESVSIHVSRTLNYLSLPVQPFASEISSSTPSSRQGLVSQQQ